MKNMLMATAAMLLVANVTLAQTPQAGGKRVGVERLEPALQPLALRPLAG